MKQVLQHRKNGTVAVTDVPAPQARSSGILVQTAASLISAGTEKAALELSQKSMVGMARERPDLVGRVMDKLQRDGFAATWNAVRDQLDREVPLGYSAAGTVVDVGRDASEFSRGQRVACAGAGHASHAEVNFVPRLLATPIPKDVSDEQAAYTTVGAIALQGVRNADVRVGESVAVVGLGLIGQLACQLLAASGVQVIGIDLSHERAALANAHGARYVAHGNDEAEPLVAAATHGRGVDAVLICAATKSNEPVEVAAHIARDRARVVMVGVTGMDLPRAEYYHKELQFIVSRSYGPGRYDPSYEEHGVDYPIGHVRWTQQRNLEAFLDLVAAGRVKPEVLTTHRFEITQATAAYEMILSGSEPHLGVLLTYPQSEEATAARITLPRESSPSEATTGERRIGVSFWGAGNFARGTLLRHLARLPVDHRGVLTSSGASAVSAGKRFGFEFCTGESDELLADEGTDLVFVTTRHSRHAEQVVAALGAGKAVFCEKPLAVTVEQLAQVEAATKTNDRVLVGFNRRFAPLATTLQEHVGGSPLMMHYRANAGTLPHDHWLADPAEGGRLIGEACHFLDFAAFLTGANPTTVTAARNGDDADNVAATIEYDDGSVCQLLYATEGSMKAPKERVEVHGNGRSAVLDDFRTLTLYSPSGTKRHGSRWRQDKGHAAELTAAVEAVATGQSLPIPLSSLLATTRASFALVQAAASGQRVEVASMRADEPATDRADEEPSSTATGDE